jgi:hypothetical protein
LLQRAREADGMRVCLTGQGIVVLCVIDEPERETVLEPRTQLRFHLRFIPIGLPGECVDVHHSFQHDHLAVNATVRD